MSIIVIFYNRILKHWCVVINLLIQTIPQKKVYHFLYTCHLRIKSLNHNFRLRVLFSIMLYNLHWMPFQFDVLFTKQITGAVNEDTIEGRLTFSCSMYLNNHLYESFRCWYVYFDDVMWTKLTNFCSLAHIYILNIISHFISLWKS